MGWNQTYRCYWSYTYLPFSILSWIEWGETNPYWVSKLSVSSLGSNGVKPIRWIFRFGWIGLSVSSLGSNGVKLWYWGWCVCHTNAFSILSWIEWGETILLNHRKTVVAAFQYPLLDRMGWNLWKRLPIRMQLRLSVSSLGSNGVKRVLLS